MSGADKRGDCERTVKRASGRPRPGSLQYDDTESEPRGQGASSAADADPGPHLSIAHMTRILAGPSGVEGVRDRSVF